MWGWLSDFKGHVYQHQFRIKRNRSGKVIIHYKKWSTSKKWLGKDIALIDETPELILHLQQPNTDLETVNGLKRDITKYRFYFNEENTKVRIFSDLLKQSFINRHLIIYLRGG